MTMFKKKNTVKNAIKEDGVKVEKKKAISHEYFGTIDKKNLVGVPKWEIRIRLHDDGMSIVGNTTEDQLMKFLTMGLFHCLDALMDQNHFSKMRKCLLAMKWSVDLEKLTHDLLASEEEDDG